MPAGDQKRLSSHRTGSSPNAAATPGLLLTNASNEMPRRSRYSASSAVVPNVRPFHATRAWASSFPAAGPDAVAMPEHTSRSDRAAATR